MAIFITTINDRSVDDARFYVRLTYLSAQDWRAEVWLRGGQDLFDNDGYPDRIAAQRAASTFIRGYLDVKT